MNTDSAHTATQAAHGGASNSPGGDDAKFAAAIGLSTPDGDGGSKWSLRRKPRPDTTGRPLVTAETADAAAAAIGSGAAFDAGVSATAATQVGASSARVDEATGPIPTITPQHTGPTPAQAPARSPQVAAPTQRPIVGVSPAPTNESSPLAWWRRRRMRVRRVRRTIRHIDPWSVFKVSLILFACVYVAAMAAGVLLWNAAVDSGIIERFQSFVEDVGVFETFVIEGDTLFRAASIIGVVMVAAGAALSVVLTILFNLISDLTGGVRVTILEEDLGRPARR
ncbi:MAG: DUF3566 domain-containing protein [Acidimicrobiales bacterium]